MNKLIIAIVAILIVGTVGLFAYNQANKTAHNDTTIAQNKTTTKNSISSATNDFTQNNMNNSMNDTLMSNSDSDSMMSDTSSIKEVTVTGSSYKYDPNKIMVNKGDKVQIKFVNAGGFHDWNLDEFNAHTKQIQTGQEDTIQFTADKIGTFEYYCSVGNHRQLGMVGTFVVQ